MSRTCDGVVRGILRRSIHHGKNNMIHRILVSGLVLAALSSTALASNGRNPGSLLLFPEFDNTLGRKSIITVTNVDTDQVTDKHIFVEFVFIGREDPEEDDCREFNRKEELSAADTLTAITEVFVPDPTEGYLIAFARAVDSSSGTPQPGVPIMHNYLTGNIITLDGMNQFEYSVNPVSYRANARPEFGPAGAQNPNELYFNGNSTPGDGIPNGYTTTPQQLVIPRFLGQGGNRNSELVLIGLTGGTQAETTVDLLIWNDNEEVFSSEYSFVCWERVSLLNISALFGQNFLVTTNHDPQEIKGHAALEAGWMHVQGALWTNSPDQGMDPSVYAVLIETIENPAMMNTLGMGDLPFEMGIGLTNGSVKTVQL